MRYIAEDATLRFRFNTRRFSSGAPYTLDGTPSLCVYPEDSDTQITAGITLTADYDSVTGLNNVVIDLSASASYAAGKKYEVTIAAGTVDSVSVVGAVVYEFYIHASGGLEALITRGILALPNAAADAAGGLPISDAGGLDLDAKIGALTYGTANRVNVQVYGMEANVVTSTAINNDAITAAKIANGAIDAATFAADVDAEFLSYIVDDATRIDASALNTASGAIGSNGSGLTEAGGTGDHLSAVPWNAAWDAEVQSEVQDAIEVNKLDHLVAVADADDVADNSIIAKLASKGATADWSSYVNTTDSLEALRDRGDAAWITATSVTVSDKTGFKLASDGLDLVTAWTVAITGNITGNLSGSVGSVTGAVGSVTGNVGGNVTGTVASVVTKTGYSLASTGLDLVLIDGKTLPVAMQIIAAVAAGEISGAGTGTEVFLGLDGATTRVTVTVDSSGNRTTVVYA